MKKLLALILAVICCLGMVACGGEDHSKTLNDAVSFLNTLYKDMNRTPADYELVGSIPIDGKTVKVTWTVSNSAIKVVKNGAMVNIDVPDENAAETAYVLKATVSVGGQKKTKEFNLTLPVIIFNPYAVQPVEGTAYKLIMIQVTLGKNLYATHEISGSKYYGSTEDITAAPDFFAEKVTDGYKFYTMIDGTKNYVVAYLQDGTSKRLKYATDEATVWYYKEDCRAWFTMINGGEYVLGTYGSYNTFSISESKHIKPDNTGITQFPGNLITVENASKLSPIETPEGPELPEADTTLTVAQIIDFAAEMISDVYSEGKYYVVGEITEIYNEQYGNMKIKDANGNILTIYGTYSADGETRFDALETKPAVGDTIKVYGIIGQYNGTAQVKNGWIIEINPAA